MCGVSRAFSVFLPRRSHSSKFAEPSSHKLRGVASSTAVIFDVEVDQRQSGGIRHLVLHDFVKLSPSGIKIDLFEKRNDNITVFDDFFQG